MSTDILLIRHGHCPASASGIAGRAPAVHLDARGRAQARLLGEWLQQEPIAAVYSGPLERVRETATAVAAPHGLAVEVMGEFDEVDYGRWTGLAFAELDALAEWRAYNRARSSMGVPGGERLLEVQARAVGGIESLRTRHPGELIAVVTHAELVRCILAHCLDLSLDTALRIQVDPASVSRVRWYEDGPVLHGVNLVLPTATADLPLSDAPR